MERQERSHQFLGSHGTAANIKEVSLRRGKRDLTSSWALMEQLQNERVDSKDRQERSHQFLGSHGTAANMKELRLRNGKRDLISSKALMEQLQT
jgi:hypothetical protein